MKVAEVQQHGNTKISKMSRWLSPTGSLAETLLSNVENEVAAAVKIVPEVASGAEKTVTWPETAPTLTSEVVTTEELPRKVVSTAVKMVIWLVSAPNLKKREEEAVVDKSATDVMRWVTSRETALTKIRTEAATSVSAWVRTLP